MNNRLIYKFRILLVIIFISGTLLISKDYNGTNHTVTIIVPKVALLDIESVTSKDLSLTMISPSEAGNPILSSSDNRIWLDVTSIVGSGNTIDISVKIDAPISGLDLKVVSDSYFGSGFGSWGTPQTEITLTAYDQILVSGIESGYTVNGINNGFNLKYIAEINNSKFGKITSTTGDSITIIYTLAL